MENQQQNLSEDQEMQSIINILNTNAGTFNNPQVVQVKDFIHTKGLAYAMKLCSLAVQSNSHPNAKYILFGNLSSFLHPRSPPDFLLEVLNQFVPLVIKEKARLSKMAICRCIANAFFHIASENTVQIIINLLQSLGNNSIIFIYELINVLECAFDVPMLSYKNYIIIVNILPSLLPNIINCFCNDPDIETYDILEFYLTKIKQIPLEFIIKNVNVEVQFNIEAFVNQMRIVLDSNILSIIKSFENPLLKDIKYHRYLSNLMNFFSLAVQYKIDPLKSFQIMKAIFKIQINSDNIDCFCEMIKTVISAEPNLLNADLINFLFIISAENAKQFNLENLKNILNVISRIFSNLYDEISPDKSPVPVNIFSQFAEQILPLIIRQYPNKAQLPNNGITIISMNPQNNINNQNAQNNTNDQNDDEQSDDDDDDDYQNDLENREEIIQCIAHFTRENPLPSLDIVRKIFYNYVQANNADEYICEWVLQLMNQFLQYNISMEKGNEETNIISQVLLEIINTPLIINFASSSPSILGIICEVFEYIDNKQMALNAFRLAVIRFCRDDNIMEKAFELAAKYKFILLDEIPPDAPLSLNILTLLASYSASPAVVNVIDNLMKTNIANKMQEATALIVGLQSSKNVQVPLNIVNYATALTNQHMFPEALKICYTDINLAMNIINLASTHKFEEDVYDRIVTNALRAALHACFGPFTEKVLIFANIPRPLDMKIIEMISKLFFEHSDPRAEMTDQSLFIFTNFTRYLLKRNVCPNKIVSYLVESLIFYFNRLYPLIDDELWYLIIHFFLYNNMDNINNDSCDILFQFFLIDFNRYQMIILKVLSEATDNAEELFAFLQNGINNDTPTTRNIYHANFICVYKAFDYYRHFT